MRVARLNEASAKSSANREKHEVVAAKPLPQVDGSMQESLSGTTEAEIVQSTQSLSQIPQLSRAARPIYQAVMIRESYDNR